MSFGIIYVCFEIVYLRIENRYCTSPTFENEELSLARLLYLSLRIDSLANKKRIQPCFEIICDFTQFTHQILSNSPTLNDETLSVSWNIICKQTCIKYIDELRIHAQKGNARFTHLFC